MLSYETCKAIAEKKAEDYGFVVNQVHSLGPNFVFDNDKEECIGVFPLVVDSRNGETMALWPYLNKFNATMDDMKEMAF